MIADAVFVTLAGVMAAFGVVRGLADLHARRWAWGACGLLLGLAVLVMPIRTHAVKIDLPIATRR